jgi:hypothetical protein
MSAVSHLIPPKIEDLGEFTVRRMLPNARQRMVGPWVFFDHMGPVTFAPGPGINVRPHPHINLCTVTYLFEGEILHRDSLGFEELIRPGDINLMVAGSGIVHSERERPEMLETERNIHALQLWLALPEADEETDADFLHYPAADLPKPEVAGVPIRVMIGSAYGVESPVKQFAKTLYVEAGLQAGQSLSAPESEELAVYVAQGELDIDGQTIPEYSLAILDTQQDITLTATQNSRIAIIGGEKPGPRRVWWNFVSSRKERIEQAKQDWAAGRFPTVPGDEEEFIPLPGS